MLAFSWHLYIAFEQTWARLDDIGPRFIRSNSKDRPKLVACDDKQGV